MMALRLKIQRLRIETIVKSRRFSFYATVALTGGKEFKEMVGWMIFVLYNALGFAQTARLKRSDGRHI